MPWQIDASHSHVGFSVKHMMVSTVKGQFKTYSGSLVIDEKDLTKSVISGQIEVASIDTRDSGRDDHLRSADFFDVANHPLITFASKRIEGKGGNAYRVTGDLTIRGVTQEVVLDAEYHGLAKDPWGGTRTGFTVSGTVNRKDYGLVWNAALETGGVLVGEKIKLELEIEAVLQEAPVTEAVAK
ncbi:MAG TPA: YceI family protein [Pantanalinema sp.]